MINRLPKKDFSILSMDGGLEKYAKTALGAVLTSSRKNERDVKYQKRIDCTRAMRYAYQGLFAQGSAPAFGLILRRHPDMELITAGKAEIICRKKDCTWSIKLWRIAAATSARS
jgi:hypothetical protein